MATQIIFESVKPLAEYMSNRLRHLRDPSQLNPRAPDWLLQSDLCEVEKAVQVILEAFERSYTTSWNIHDYIAELSPRQSGGNEDRENKLRLKFPPIAAVTRQSGIPYVYQPMHVTDRDGNIFLWYFPKILTDERMSGHNKEWIWAMTNQLNPKQRNGTWRDGPEWNNQVHPDPVNQPQVKTGIVNLSPGWFAQGHETGNYPLQPSAAMREETNQAYLSELSFSNALLGAIYSIIQPELFRSGLEALNGLGQAAPHDPLTQTALTLWQTPFTGLSVILNRETIIHRDTKGFRQSLDLLLTIGNYQHGRMHMPGLGFSVEYDPGTLVGLAGNVLEHGVCPVVGVRACLAHFFHKKVGERLGMKEPRWLTKKEILEYIMSNK